MAQRRVFAPAGRDDSRNSLWSLGRRNQAMQVAHACREANGEGIRRTRGDAAGPEPETSNTIQVWLSHGLMTPIPVSRKSETFRVASAARCNRQIAAICASNP